MFYNPYIHVSNNKNESNIMSDSHKDTRITVVLEPEVKTKYDELCKERGSNMNVELRRHIYDVLKDAGK